MSDQSPVLGLPFILPAQAQKHITHNMAIQKLDVVVQLSALSASTGAPPASPNLGARYIVRAGASAAWAGQEDTIAIWDGSGWSFTTPMAGWRAHVLDQNATVVFDGSTWAAETLDLQNLGGVGINTTSDVTNKLAVAADATLLSHTGSSHQLKINKASSGETASLLFQNNWSGRAEMGLAGNDDFSIKVSDDGASFTEALKIDASSGHSSAKCLMSGQITIADDSVGYIDTPSSGGFVLISMVSNNYPQATHSGIFVYDTGGSLANVAVFTGPGMEDHGTTTLTGTTADDGHSGFAVQAGQLQIENRLGSAKIYAYTFLGGY